MTRSKVLAVMATVYALAVLFVVLWPSHLDNDLAIRSWPPVRATADALGVSTLTVYRVIEKAMNVAMFIPVGVIVGLVLGRLGRRVALAAVVVLAAGAETVQLVFLSGRTAELTDVLANALGGLLGLLLLGSRPRPR